MSTIARTVLAAVILAGAAAGYWQFRRLQPVPAETQERTGAVEGAAWLEMLLSRNPKEAERATKHIQELGPEALPLIESTLRDQHAEADRLKGALKAAGILGQTASPLIDDVAAVLAEPGLTAEAAIALSYMGREAFPPLRDALQSKDPVVRREALRSIGKLHDRAQLQSRVVVPLLIQGMKDPDATVRAVAATYLGIIHAAPGESVPALVRGLSDTDPEVRRASAAALASFGEAAEPAIAALKKAASDQHEDVAREAAQALLTLKQKQ